jgi:hypothetical protein
MTITHGEPVEDVVVFPQGGMLVSAGVHLVVFFSAVSLGGLAC